MKILALAYCITIPLVFAEKTRFINLVSIITCHEKYKPYMTWVTFNMLKKRGKISLHIDLIQIV